MYVTMCPDLRCRVYQMNGAEFDPPDATWVPTNTLGEYSLFIGGIYPIVKQMPPSVHNTEGLAFMKHGCVFSVHYWMSDMLGHAIPDLCRSAWMSLHHVEPDWKAATMISVAHRYGSCHP